MMPSPPRAMDARAPEAEEDDGVAAAAAAASDPAEEQLLTAGDSDGDAVLRLVRPRHRVWLTAALVCAGLFVTYVFSQPGADQGRRPRDLGLRGVERLVGYDDAATEDLASDDVEDVPDQFFSLGEGSCLDIDGKYPPKLEVVEHATVLSDGSSPECEEKCRADDFCTGYMAHDTEDAVWSGGQTGKCGVFTTSDFVPTSATGKVGSKCFHRHIYKQKSKTLYNGEDQPIPKVIWSFWENMAPDGHDPPANLPPFVQMCVLVWRELNPDYEVHVLNRTSMWKYLEPEDLPVEFKSMSIQHQSDLIRLSLLSKHGGVWMDASAFTVKPLSEILEGKPNTRTFFHMPSLWADPKLKAADQRVNDLYHAYNWFLAAPPNDPLIMRTRACVTEFMKSPGRKKGLVDSGMFSKTQLQEMPVMGMGAGMGQYLSTDACMFKNVDEDFTMEAWWLSDKVRHFNPIEGLGLWWWMDMPLAREVLFHRYNQTFAGELTGKGIFVLKFNGPMRHFITDGVSADRLWCKRNTWHIILDKIGASNENLCLAGGAS